MGRSTGPRIAPPSGALVNRGELWWTETPDAGRRPTLVLTRQTAIPVLNWVLAVPATRTIRGIPTEIRLGPEDGLPDECVLSLDNIVPIPKSLFLDHIARLSGERMQQVCAALAIATGCA
jgi:mRNA interferase MazF